MVVSADTATSLAMSSGSLSATVAALSPGSGTPSGTVVFTVAGSVIGSANLTDGVATLTYVVPANTTEAIVATYQGDDDYAGSSGTATVSGARILPAVVVKPTITATLASAKPKNSHGWWHTAVTVHFSCASAGSAIVGGCPSAVSLNRSSANERVSRTITTAAGASATITLSGIKIDLTKPHVKLVGIRSHALYRGLIPPVGCVASDPVSGIASCRISTRVKHHGTSEMITYRATAISWAGVRTVASETVHARP